MSRAAHTTALVLAVLALRPASAQEPPAPTAEKTPHVLGSAYARWRAALPGGYPQLGDFRRVVVRWVAGAESYWTADKAHRDLGPCRIRTRHTHVCTARALPVYAALAADRRNDHPVWTRRKLAERLNAAVTFLCRTYDPSGKRKGCWRKRPRRNGLRYETWIIGNALDAVQMAPDALTPENSKRIREILIDIIEDERTSGRARSLSDYRHEGIIWVINLLARAALLYPDHPKADEWLDLAKHGYASSMSVPADLADETMVDGKPIKAWVARRCPVFHPDHTLTHHGLGIHPGYMAGACSRMVSIYELLGRQGKAVSPVWLHNYGAVMRTLKGLSLWDGRIAFPNGKDWGDYLYLASCIRFHMAGLQMMRADRQARLIEQGLFRQLEWLQMHRGKGDFGRSDAEYVFNVNDARSIAAAYWLHQRHGFAEPASQAELDKAVAGVVHSPHARFVAVRDPRRFASWGWKARRGRTTGIILPRGHGLGDHLAQWDYSFVPTYWSVDWRGRRSELKLQAGTRQVETFPGGFAASERTEAGSPARIVDHRVMAALPDGRTVLVAASARAARSLGWTATNDLNWRFVRNVFSDYERTIFYEGGQKECRHVANLDTPWFNVDGILGVVPIGRPARLTCELVGEVGPSGRPKADRDLWATTHGQTVRLSAFSLPARVYVRGQELYTACVAFVTDADAAETRRLAAAAYQEEKPSDTVRIYRARGLDGTRYAMAVNFADATADVAVPGASQAELLTPKAARVRARTPQALSLRLAPRACALLKSPRQR